LPGHRQADLRLRGLRLLRGALLRENVDARGDRVRARELAASVGVARPDRCGGGGGRAASSGRAAGGGSLGLVLLRLGRRVVELVVDAQRAAEQALSDKSAELDTERAQWRDEMTLQSHAFEEAQRAMEKVVAPIMSKLQPAWCWPFQHSPQ
jgi:hypothetical protein